MSTRNSFIALMLVAGALLGLAARTWPGFANFGVPPFAWLLGVSLAFDLVMMARAWRGQIEPLNINMRALGFVAGAGLCVGITAI